MVTQEELNNMSPEEIAELQKQNCPFCKIVKGEIPSSKVFDDDLILAILDINPAKKGHTILLPKEHIPIMPVCPPDVFKRLFHTAKLVSIGQKKGVLVPKTTLFIANGAVAGQQAAHFLFHIIPRENNDGLSNFDIKSNDEFLVDQEKMFSSLKNNMTIMMQKHAQREGKSYAKQNDSSSSNASSSPSITELPSSDQNSNQQITNQELLDKKREQIAQIVESNPQVRDLLVNNPEEFKKQVLLNEQLKQIFEGVDVDNLSKGLKEIAENTVSSEQNNKKPEVFLGSDPYSQKEKVFTYFKEKPKAKDLLINDLDTFKELLSKRSDVQEIFIDVDLDKLSEKLLEAEQYEKEQKQKEGVGTND